MKAVVYKTPQLYRNHLKIMETSNITLINLLPSKKAMLQAGVSSIPVVGSALDHLIFDKADEIAFKNLKKALDEIALRVGQLEQHSINEDWFSSNEALSIFYTMVEKIRFEPDNKKISALSSVFVTAGTKDFAEDKRKLSVYDHISRLSYIQMKLLQIISGIEHQQKKVGRGGISQNLSGIWISQIEEALPKNKDDQFWNGEMNLNLELEVLEAQNMLRRFASFGNDETTFELTALGKLASTYLTKIN